MGFRGLVMWKSVFLLIIGLIILMLVGGILGGLTNNTPLYGLVLLICVIIGGAYGTIGMMWFSSKYLFK